MSLLDAAASSAGPHVRRAANSDVAEWIRLAGEVGDLFGADIAADPAFEAGVHRNIERGTAFCVRVDGELAGGMFFHKDRISWLVVARRHRRRGVGRALVSHATSTAIHEVRVTTFGEDHPHPDSAAARALYTALGFERAEDDPGEAPDGSPRQVFVWRP